VNTIAENKMTTIFLLKKEVKNPTRNINSTPFTFWVVPK